MPTAKSRRQPPNSFFCCCCTVMAVFMTVFISSPFTYVSVSRHKHNQTSDGHVNGGGVKVQTKKIKRNTATSSHDHKIVLDHDIVLISVQLYYLPPYILNILSVVSNSQNEKVKGNS